jgi:presenilin-like A22 family membrane protease
MKTRLSPFLWSAVFMVLSLALTLYVASLQQVFVEEQNIPSPDVALGPVVLYFFGVVAVIALVLFFIPLRWLRWVFRLLFALMYAWGAFVIAALSLPVAAAYAIAAVCGLAWLLWARVWLHNVLLLVALAAAGSVFGFLFSPWTFMIFMLVIAVYDVVAVRFGFMVWMADKLSATVALPAFIFPRRWRDWLMGLGGVRVGELKEQAVEAREYSVLGGGDIGFPLMLAVAVFFVGGLGDAILVGVFALAGLMGAFLIQALWFRGKPVPALPPIAGLSLVGFLIVTYA